MASPGDVALGFLTGTDDTVADEAEHLRPSLLVRVLGCREDHQPIPHRIIDQLHADGIGPQGRQAEPAGP